MVVAHPVEDEDLESIVTPARRPRLIQKKSPFVYEVDQMRKEARRQAGPGEGQPLPPAVEGEPADTPGARSSSEGPPADQNAASGPPSAFEQGVVQNAMEEVQDVVMSMEGAQPGHAGLAAVNDAFGEQVVRGTPFGPAREYVRLPQRYELRVAMAASHGAGNAVLTTVHRQFMVRAASQPFTIPPRHAYATDTSHVTEMLSTDSALA